MLKPLAHPSKKSLSSSEVRCQNHRRKIKMDKVLKLSDTSQCMLDMAALIGQMLSD